MFSLIDVNFVTTRLKLPQDSSLEQTISECITAASPFLESATQSTFDSSPREDIFFLDGCDVIGSKGITLLKLSSGFIRSDAPVTVVCSGTLEGLQLTAQPVQVLKLNSELGHVVVKEQKAELYFKVTYEAGFEKLEEVPQWLRECAYIQTLLSLSLLQIDDEAPVSTIYGDLKSTMTRLLDSHVRVRGYAVSPLL